MLTKCLTLYAKRHDAKNQMLYTVCQKNKCKSQMLLRNVNMISQVYQHTERVMKYKKKSLSRKVNLLQRPSSLKHLNFKMECFC